MSKAKYVAFDCETGGIDPTKHSLLTVYMVLLDEKLNVLQPSDIAYRDIAVDSKEYVLTAEAMNVNKIDIRTHKGMRSDAAAYSLNNLLLGQKDLIPIGHNVKFDIDFITHHLLSRDVWKQYVSHRPLDTAIIGNFLKLQGKIPEDVSSLSGYCKHFGIEIDAHTAKGDTLATVALLKKMMEL